MNNVEKTQVVTSYTEMVSATNAVGSSKKGSLKWAENLRLEAQALVKHIQRSYLRLAELIYTVWDSHTDDDPTKPPLYEAWGYKTLAEWGRQELGIEERRLSFLKRVHYVLHVKLKGIDPAVHKRLTALPYSKMRELSSVLTTKNAEGWVEVGETTSYGKLLPKVTEYRRLCMDEVQRKVEAGTVDPREVTKRKAITQSGGAVPVPGADASRPPMRGFRCRLYEDQERLVNQALEASAAFSGSEGVGHNLTLMCMDFLATHGGARPGSASFQGYLEMLERHFDVKMVAFESLLPPEMEKRAPEMLYGGEYLGKILGARADRHNPERPCEDIEIDAEEVS